MNKIPTANFGESGYRDGGYVYVKPPASRITRDRVVSEETAQAEVQSYTAQLVTHPCRGNKWRPFFDILDEGPAKVALEGLKNAIDVFCRQDVPVVAITVDALGTSAVLADLAKYQEMQSWFNVSNRGVLALGGAVLLSNKSHAAVFGNRNGIIEIDASDPDIAVPQPILVKNYLPHTQDTNYTVRPTGVSAVGIGPTVGRLLDDNGLGHILEQYEASARVHARS